MHDQVGDDEAEHDARGRDHEGQQQLRPEPDDLPDIAFEQQKQDHRRQQRILQPVADAVDRVVVEQADGVEQGRHDVEEDEPGDILEYSELPAVAGDDENRRNRQQQADE